MNRVLNFGFIILGVAGSVVTIVVAWWQWAAGSSQDGKIGLIILTFFLAVLLIFTVFQEYRYSRKARYSEVFPDLNLVYARIHDILISEPSPQEIVTVCTLITNRLAALLSLASATHCSVCIKVIDPGSNRPKVITLARDEASEHRERASVSVDHFIDVNTDFRYLFERAGMPNGRYFFSKHLPTERDYMNTSFAIYGEPSKITWPIIGDIIRASRWPLPYKSTIVVPISPRQRPGGAARLSGFLCVDSRSRSAFTNRYDPEVLIGVADCLYEILDLYSAAAWQSQEENK